jgi:hypothetical protein
MEQYRHGDLLIVRVDSVPKGCSVKKDRILAEGEVTGHHHRLSEGGTVLTKGDDMFLDIKEKAELTHEEHGPILFSTGTYRVIRQREFSPERNRYVAD